MSKISNFYLVSVAEETGFSLALLETPKTGFLATRPNYFLHLALHKWDMGVDCVEKWLSEVRISYTWTSSGKSPVLFTSQGCDTEVQ